MEERGTFGEKGEPRDSGAKVGTAVPTKSSWEEEVVFGTSFGFPHVFFSPVGQLLPRTTFLHRPSRRHAAASGFPYDHTGPFSLLQPLNIRPTKSSNTNFPFPTWLWIHFHLVLSVNPKTHSFSQ